MRHADRPYADLRVIDDPIAPRTFTTLHAANVLKNRLDAEVIQRLNDKTTGAAIVVMQQLHIDDLAGHQVRTAS